jgi:hypothetical protein
MTDPIGDLAAKFERAYRDGQVKLLTPLPRKVRLRLWLHSQADRIGCWLCDHRHPEAAIAFWRACGMWGPHPPPYPPRRIHHGSRCGCTRCRAR